MQQACKGLNHHQFFHDGVVTMPAMLALDPSRLKFDTWTTCCWWLGAQCTNVTSSDWALSLVQKRGKCWILEARRWINLRMSCGGFVVQLLSAFVKTYFQSLLWLLSFEVSLEFLWAATMALLPAWTMLGTICTVAMSEHLICGPTIDRQKKFGQGKD